MLLWFPMLVIAIANGALRELLLKKFLGELAAHQVSTLLLLFFFTVYVYYVVGRFPPSSTLQAFHLGLLWMTLTLLFEFGFGKLRGNSWEKLLADYNVTKGRIWVLIPLWICIAPWILFTMMH